MRNGGDNSGDIYNSISSQEYRLTNTTDIARARTHIMRVNFALYSHSILFSVPANANTSHCALRNRKMCRSSSVTHANNRLDFHIFHNAVIYIE